MKCRTRFSKKFYLNKTAELHCEDVRSLEQSKQRKQKWSWQAFNLVFIFYYMSRGLRRETRHRCTASMYRYSSGFSWSRRPPTTNCVSKTKNWQTNTFPMNSGCFHRSMTGSVSILQFSVFHTFVSNSFLLLFFTRHFLCQAVCTQRTPKGPE